MSKPDVDLRSVIKRRGWIALPVFVSTLGASLLYLGTVPPEYETSAQLIVDDKEVSVSDLGQKLTGITTNAPGQAADPVATQAELVRSQGVLRRTLDSLRSQVGITEKELPTTNQLRRSIKVKILPGTNILDISVKGKDPKLTADLVNEILEASLAENIEAVRREASVVREFLESKVPQQQQQLYQAELAESQYRQASGIVSLEVQTQELVNQRAALETERNQIIAQLQEAITRDRQLQKITGTLAPEVAYDSVRLGQDQELQTLQGKITELETTIADAGTRLGEQHPDWLALLEEREALVSLYQTRLGSLLPQASQQQIAVGALSQDLLAQYITNDIDRQGLESRLAIVDQEFNNMDARLLELPAQQQPLANLVRARQEAETALQFLQNKLEEARLAEAQLISSVRIIGLAEVPRQPIAPKPLLVLALALIASGALSAAMMVLLESADSTLRTAAAAEEALKLPVLGILPKMSPRRNPSQLAAFLENPDLFEPYRSLLKNLTFQRQSLGQLKTYRNSNGNITSTALEASLRPQGQTIVVTSPFPKEGKSTVALHLAATAAMLSKKTLLIDADFRSPSQNLMLEVPAYPGLTEAMANPEALPEIVKATSVDNLFVLTYGQLVTQPSILAEGAAIRSVIAEAATHYDLVVIDTASASRCADASTLSQYTDGLLLTLRAGVSQQGPAIHLVSELKKNGASILGIAFNGITSGEEGMYANVRSEQLQLLPYAEVDSETRVADRTTLRT